jgi:hypothetical protein
MGGPQDDEVSYACRTESIFSEDPTEETLAMDPDIE